MVSAGAPLPRPDNPGQGSWIWGRRIDLSVFGGSAVAALALVWLAPSISNGSALPLWGFILLVVAIDVAHVYSTLFRTYLDPEERRARPMLYWGVPVACYCVGVLLHAHGALTFWRVLAYLAVFHFVRQQVGWVAIYRAKAREFSPWDRRIDNAVVYLATGWPLLYWHAHLPREFRWFVANDFMDLSALRPVVTPVLALYLIALGAYCYRALRRFRNGHRPNYGKHLVVGITASTWYVGIVATNSDFQFTAANVIVHGVPYLALLWAYARQRAPAMPSSLMRRLVLLGIGASFALLLALAFTEELLWEWMVWHDHESMLGAGLSSDWMDHWGKVVIVPLLAVPQATHYVLDAVLWRRRDTRGAQTRALGFTEA